MENLFDQYANIPALEQETSKILDMFKQVKKGILDLSKLGLKIDTSKGMAELNAQAKQLEEVQKRITDSQNKLIEQEQKLADLNRMLAEGYKNQASGADAANKVFGTMNENIIRQIELSKKLQAVRADIKKLGEFDNVESPAITAQLTQLKGEEATLKAELGDVNKFIRNQAKEFIATGDSVDAMKARLAQLTQQYDATDSAFKNSEAGKVLTEQITELTAALDKELSGTGRFNQRVGNYQGSAKIIVDALKDVEKELQNLKAKETELKNFGSRDPIGFKLQGQDAELKQVSAQIGFLTTQAEGLSKVTQNPQFLNVAGKVGDITAETRFFTKALAELEQQGLKNTDTYNKMQARLAELTDLMADTRAEVKALSSDTRGFDLMASAIGSVSSAFQVAASTAEVFGGNNQDIQKSIQRLIAIQNIANGVRQIATDLTTRGTAANKAYAYVQNLVATATNASATATTRLMAILKGAGILALIGALVWAADKMNLFGSSTADTEKEMDKLNHTIARQNQLLDENIRKIDASTQININKQKERLALENAAREAQYAGMSEEAANAARRDKSLQDENFLRAQSIVGIVKENQLRRGLADQIESQVRKEANLYGYRLNTVENINAAIYDAESRNNTKLATRMTQLRDLRKNIEEGQTTISVLNSETRIGVGQKELEDAKERAKKQREYLDNEKKYALELRNYRLGLLADEQAATKNLQIPGLSETAARQEFALRKQIIDNQRDYDISQLNVTASQRKSIILKANEAISNLEAQLGIDIINIRRTWNEQGLQAQKEFNDQLEQAEHDRVQRIQDINQGLLEHRTDRADLQAAQETKLAEDRFRTGVTNEEKYQKEIEDIQIRAQKRRIEAQIIYYTDQIKILKAAGADTLAMEKALAEAEAALANVDQHIVTDKKKRTKEDVQEIAQIFIDSSKSIFDAYGSVINSFADANLNQIQEQMDALDKLTERQVKQVEQSADSEEQKQQRIALINRKAEADRDALERRRQQVERQRAIFERASKAFSITTDTIVAVNKIRLEAAAAVNPVIKAALLAQSFIAGALGAAQLVALLATPIPKYFKGGVPKQGLGMVADAGMELVQNRKSNRVQLFTEPTLTSFTGDEYIYPYSVTKRILEKTGFSNRGNSINGGSVVNFDDTRMVDELKKQNKKPPVTIVISEKLEATAWYQTQIKY